MAILSAVTYSDPAISRQKGSVAMKSILISLVLAFPMLAQAEYDCSNFPSNCYCLPQAKEWAEKFAVWYGYKECAGKPVVLDNVTTPAPNAIEYSFHADCDGKTAHVLVPLNTGCQYTGE